MQFIEFEAESDSDVLTDSDESVKLEEDFTKQIQQQQTSKECHPAKPANSAADFK
jgi:hypothetical protein